MSVEIKEKIRDCITSFKAGNLTKNAIALFNCLGYNTDRQAPLSNPTYKEFKQSFVAENSRFKEENAYTDKWNYVDLLFQLTKDEVSRHNSLFDTKQVDSTIIETYLFFAIELDGTCTYRRTDLAKITREVNKLFPMPVMILFKTGKNLTFAVINRRLHKRDESKDVLEKVTVIKDINIEKPHPAHILILRDLSFDNLLEHFRFTNFVELHKAWQNILDTEELNKIFYQKLANWYYWAKDVVQFPDDIEKDKELRNATATIRLITRIIFVWFIREKFLIPDALFDIKFLKSILKGFTAPETSSNSVFYKAILQNLFFATLSTKKGERKFRSKEWKNGHNVDFGIQHVYRYEEMVSDTYTWKNLFAEVPFLNGGLFENLDNKKKKILVDGFSEERRNCLSVPDYLFFSEERCVDLNKTYATTGKKYIVKGLIRILDEYKFTIAENTPIEEEVALDPELLGKVFENLLASFNPETKTTARKHTGSFYTPREIVDYMVDESLKNVIAKKVSLKLLNTSLVDIKSGLDILFAYTEKEHTFTPTEVRAIVEEIANLKILDPACGSGAFPMGILHKLVFILEKLDRDNKIWFELQKKKAIVDTQSAFDLGESSARQARLKEIEESFNFNTSDYGRKLYLIETAIYGVDKQPIAVQISKLRFFISLIVDQNVKDDLIKPLPNLETKFVAADTLVGKIKLPQHNDLFHNQKIDELEKKLEHIRHNHFRAQSPQEKEQLRELDKNVREEMVELLKKENPANKDLAAQLLGWDPYDQNHHALFFDSRWMYGTTDHFDIVIGNPPYVQIQNFSGKPEQQLWENQGYKTFSKTGDVYCLFYEKGNSFLNENGILCFITSNKWMRANYGLKLRKYFIENTNPILLIDFGSYQVFESATVDTNILFFEKFSETLYAKGTGNLKKDYRKKIATEACAINESFCRETDVGNFINKNKVLLKNLTEDSWVISSNEEYAVKKRIETIGVPLKDWDISINYGIKTGLNEAFIIDSSKKGELIQNDPNSIEILKPILLGKDIKRYRIEYQDLWLINAHNGYTACSGEEIPAVNVKKGFPAIWSHFNKVNKELEGKIEARYDQGSHWTNLRNCAYVGEFDKAKIAWGNLALSSQFALVPAGYFINAPSPLITPGNKYLLAVLNSKLGDYYIRSLGVTRSGGYFEYKPMFVEKLPVPRIEPIQQRPYEILVDYILFSKMQKMDSESLFFETIIDGLVYELYFARELASAKCDILKHLPELSKFQSSISESKKKKIVEECYTVLSDPNHPLTKSLYKLETVKEVQIIEGRK